MDLNSRKFKILQAIIDDYILSGVPVGSRTISKKSGLGLSSATIRNEMSDLEDLGFLEQPHISAGRVPSVKAYRLYVDSLLNNGDIKSTSNEAVHDYFSSHIQRMEDVIARATQILSELTNYTAIAITPNARVLKIRNVQLVRVSDASALLVIVFEGGIVHNKVISISPSLNAESLHSLSSILSEKLDGVMLNQAGDILKDVLINLNMSSEFVNRVNASLDSIYEESKEIKLAMGGTSNIFNYPEYADIEKAKEILSLFDTRNELIELLKNNGEMNITVKIGPENGVDGLINCSVITAQYKTANDLQGSIGIIGPTRMPYQHIMRVLESISHQLTELFDNKEN